MTEWTDKLTARERREWDKFVHHNRTSGFQAMDESAFVMSLAPMDGRPDIKFCVELGMAIMLDKPILTVVTPQVPVPRRLRRVADEIVAVEDIDTTAGQKYLAERLREFKVWHQI